MRYDAKDGITVMLVDTNEKFLQHFFRFLKTKLPYKFIFEKNGTRALLTADKKPVHLFLMEAKLTPQVSGYRTLELIKNDDKLSDIPVIFVSALRDKISVSKAMALGVDDYLHKPIIPEEVLDRVVKFLKKSLKFKILYVDSDESLFPRVKSIVQHLFPYQAEVVTANSAPAGMEIIDTQEVNLLIVGNNMPIIKGTRMLTMLKDQEKLDKLAVVLLPEELTEADRYAVAELEIEHYAEKPFNKPEEFISTIMAALNVPPIPFLDDLMPD